MNILNDTLSILLANRINDHLPAKDRCLKIAYCCNIVKKRTQDSKLKAACESIIYAIQQRKYKSAIKAVELTERNYWMGRA